jgi:hypothetical protein
MKQMCTLSLPAISSQLWCTRSPAAYQVLGLQKMTAATPALVL